MTLYLLLLSRANRNSLGVQVCKQAVAWAKQKKEGVEKEHTDHKLTKATEEDVRSQELNRFKQDVDRLRGLRDRLQL